MDAPSTPVTPSPSTRFWVSLKGTRSGVSKFFPYNNLWVKSETREFIAYLVKNAIEIHMDDISRVSIKQDILTMPVAETTTSINDNGCTKFKTLTQE